MQRLALLIGCLAGLFFPVICFSLGVEFAAGGWNPSPNGDLSYKFSSHTDTINLSDDLNYDSEFDFNSRLKIDMPLLLPNLYLAFNRMSFDDVGLKNVDFKFGDVEFEGDVPFYSKLELHHYDIGLYYGIPFVKIATAGMVNIDAGLNLRVVDFSAEIDQRKNRLNESKSYVLPIPLMYLSAQIQPTERLGFEADLKGLTINSDSYYSLIGKVKFQIFGPAFAGVGYRYDLLDIEEDELWIDADFGGFFFEVGSKF